MKTTYKNYTIQTDDAGYYHSPKLIIFPTDQGIQHDYDYIDGSFIYMGNCKRANSIEEAISIIDEIVPFFVETYTRENRSGLNITKFDFLKEAIEFASKFNGTIVGVEFKNI
jgi:hypothetical protein